MANTDEPRRARKSQSETSAPKSQDSPIVSVRRQWNDWRHATYRLDDIAGLHWSSVSDGVQAAAPRAFVHGYVLCDRMIDGELGHSCRHGPAPHRIKICIPKKGNERFSIS